MFMKMRETHPTRVTSPPPKSLSLECVLAMACRALIKNRSRWYWFSHFVLFSGRKLTSVYYIVLWSVYCKMYENIWKIIISHLLYDERVCEPGIVRMHWHPSNAKSGTHEIRSNVNEQRWKGLPHHTNYTASTRLLFRQRAKCAPTTTSNTNG